ncbi:DUF885 domain-containing protein [Allosphingosinicella indica]|uniref:Uncharacterized conserved protein, DUF885 familyt n=1 Tax=Allosphingosinicella indica TaxID=941907 RepID=A0A1X7G059_9SPHN|nr:DUF885 domain-containing protein [Allosphingosinicella indica]SMF61719.1 Uncharacterized conserved protein, DUF885 familyt [Allosphingosinicella indica]
MTRLMLSAALIALAAPAAVAQNAAPAASATAQRPANAELAAFFEAYDKASLALSPRAKAYRAIIDADYGKWGDQSDAADVQRQQLAERTLADLKAKFPRASLSPQDQLSYDLFENMVQRSSGAFRFRKNGYIFDQMNGVQSGLPAFLINIHRVKDQATAEAYVSRLATMDVAIDQSLAEAKARADAGVMPPKWVYPYVISDAKNVVTGAPFDQSGKDSALYEDLKKKVNALDIPAAEKTRIIDAGAKALVEKVKPAYGRIVAEMERQQAIAPTDDGVWRFANGADYYNERLGFYTTTDYTAEQIHDIGLKETKRIHDEMRAIMKQVGFKGDLKAFFEHVRTDPRYYHTTREAYLAEVDKALTRMEAALPNYFNTLPKSELVVKPVEAFREKSAGKAFYNSPAPDGSRPGTYYVNLYNLKDMPKTELEALAYHEGVPGHHLQRSVQTELGDKVPPFRRFGGATVYSEGWGLYSEELAKDMGFYTDPYSDFGRLGMELWRAGRLVVDTGLHSKRWSREEAIQWLKDNTPNPDGDIEKGIERYIVYPGQATAYMIGKLKIMELRENARKELGDRFDIKAFHDAVLLPGPVPLDILEKNVAAWVAERKAG